MCKLRQRVVARAHDHNAIAMTGQRDQGVATGAAADLLGDHAKKMEAVEVVRVYRENFPVVVLGFRELARLVMPLPSSQQLTNLV